MTITGGCLCGNLRYEARGDPLWVGYCYCRWCQRHSGAPFLVWVLFDAGNLLWTRGTLATYASSREVERGFCLRCGSTLTFARPRRKEISVSSGSLDEPNLIEPQVHLFTDHQVAWLHNADRLPRYKRFPPGAEDREQDESPNA